MLNISRMYNGAFLLPERCRGRYAGSLAMIMNNRSETDSRDKQTQVKIIYNR